MRSLALAIFHCCVTEYSVLLSGGGAGENARLSSASKRRWLAVS